MVKPSIILRKKHILWLISALILGSFIFFIWPSSVIEDDIFIPIETQGIPDGLTLAPPLPKGFEIRVSGSASAIKTLKKEGHNYTLDLTNKDIGILTIPISTDDISFPPDVTIIKITPPFLNISIERERMKIVPINISLSGKIASGHTISKITATPESVTLKGPKSLIDPIKIINTKPVDINGTVDSFKKETALDLVDGIQNINPSEAVRVEITIQEKIDIRDFQNITVQGLHTKYSYHISPATIKIKVKGPSNALNNPDIAKKLNVHIDLKNLQPGIYMKPASIVLPVGITLIQVEPEIFSVEISAKPAASK